MVDRLKFWREFYLKCRIFYKWISDSRFVIKEYVSFRLVFVERIVLLFMIIIFYGLFEFNFNRRLFYRK